MAFIDSERSATGSRPIELYRFTADGQSYYLTDSPVPYTDDGHTYQPSAQLRRESIVRGALSDRAPEMVISVAESEAMVQALCYEHLPVEFTVRIYRVQPGGTAVWWDGAVAGSSSRGDRVELRCPSILDDQMKDEVPSAKFVGQCQHFLYDRHCRLDPLDWANATTITSISGVDLVVGAVAGFPDFRDYYRGGTALSLSGERRTIVAQQQVAPYTGMTLFTPFRSAAAGEAITIYPGCDRKIGTCVDKFSNRDHFGGFPTVPLRNLFRNGFGGGS